MTQAEVDKFGIPTLDSVGRMPLAENAVSDARLEKILGRKLTPTEASAAESMASEHASYGSSRFYLKTMLPANGPNHVASIGEEAACAVFLVDSETSKSIVIAYSSESHNGPSYVCPHPGAGTGTGGNERDNIAKTATKPDAVYEARRQCHPLHNPHKDPVKQHTDETTKGIADYANAMGIPHGDGSIKFDPRFAGNNLVNVFAASIAHKDRLMRNKVPTTDVPEKFVAVYIGKASDKTGIGGTKFASVAIDMTNTDLNEKAVQDPDPHLQEADVRGLEKVIDSAIAEGWKDKISLKDMGAAGLVCSTLEQLHGKIGVVINGDLVPQNEPRTSTELLEAETQERFFIYVHEDHVQGVLDIFNNEVGLPHINKGACAKIIGRCNSTGRYTFVRNGVVDVDMPAEDFASGPLLFRPVKEQFRKPEKIPTTDKPLFEHVLAVLDSINFKSDAYVHDHYDKHVRSTNIVNRGQSCATLRTHPLLKGKAGYSAVFDSNCVYGLLDPKFQAEDALVRAAYRMAAVGCSVIGVSNNANYGRTTVPEEMWQFVKGQEGVAKACYNWNLAEDYLNEISKDPEIAERLKSDPRRHVTVNGGNCSLNKANANTGTAIPPTTILGVVGWTNAPDRYATWDLKPENSKLFLVGARQPHLGGTDYVQVMHGPQCLADKLFDIDYETCRKEVSAVISAVRSGYVSAANAIEEGGLCNAVAEMAANSSADISAVIDVNAIMGKFHNHNNLSAQQKLFSESHGIVVQVNKQNENEFLRVMANHGVQAYNIGWVKAEKEGRVSFGDEFISQSEVKSKYFGKLEHVLGAA